MGDIKKEVEQIEVEKPKVVKPKKQVKKKEVYKFLEDVGTDKNGCIRYEKGRSYSDLTKEQIDNYLQNKLICQI